MSLTETYSVNEQKFYDSCNDYIDLFHVTVNSVLIAIPQSITLAVGYSLMVLLCTPKLSACSNSTATTLRRQ